MSYPVADTLIRIKNAYLARHNKVSVPYSRLKQSLGEILAKKGFIGSLEIVKDKKNKNKKEIVIHLKFLKRKPVLRGIKIISKPSLRVYVSKNKIPKVFGGLGTTIISTSKGLMTGGEAKKQNLGGEFLCEVW